MNLYKRIEMCSMCEVRIQTEIGVVEYIEKIYNFSRAVLISPNSPPQ